MVANTILSFLPNVVTTLISFGGAFVIVIQHDPVMAVIALLGAPYLLLLQDIRQSVCGSFRETIRM